MYVYRNRRIITQKYLKCHLIYPTLKVEFRKKLIKLFKLKDHSWSD